MVDDDEQTTLSRLMVDQFAADYPDALIHRIPHSVRAREAPGADVPDGASKLADHASEVIELRVDPVQPLPLLDLGLAQRAEHPGVAAELGANIGNVGVRAGGQRAGCRGFLAYDGQLGLQGGDPPFEFLKAAHRGSVLLRRAGAGEGRVCGGQVGAQAVEVGGLALDLLLDGLGPVGRPRWAASSVRSRSVSAAAARVCSVASWVRTSPSSSTSRSPWSGRRAGVRRWRRGSDGRT